MLRRYLIFDPASAHCGFICLPFSCSSIDNNLLVFPSSWAPRCLHWPATHLRASLDPLDSTTVLPWPALTMLCVPTSVRPSPVRCPPHGHKPITRSRSQVNKSSVIYSRRSRWVDNTCGVTPKSKNRPPPFVGKPWLQTISDECDDCC